MDYKNNIAAQQLVARGKPVTETTLTEPQLGLWKGVQGTDNWSEAKREAANLSSVGMQQKDLQNFVTRFNQTHDDNGKLIAQADFDKKVYEQPDLFETAYTPARDFEGAASRARHEARQAGAAEGEAKIAGDKAGAGSVMHNLGEGVKNMALVGGATVAGANLLQRPSVGKAAGAALAAAPLMTGSKSAEETTLTPNTTTPAPAPKVEENVLTEIESAKTPERAAEEATEKAVEIAGRDMPQVDLASMKDSAARVLGLTGDKKKDALKWIALGVSAFGNGWQGKQSPLLEQIREDFAARRTHELGEKEKETQQLRDIELREWDAKSDAEKQKLANELNKDFAKFNMPLDVAKIRAVGGVEFENMMRIRDAAGDDPKKWAQIQKAMNGETKMDTAAKYVGVGVDTLKTAALTFMALRGK